MIRFKFTVAWYVTSNNLSWSNDLSSLTYLGRAKEARLQTAISSGAVYSIISVHRLEDLIVPRFCWLDLAFAASLYNIYGVPVSIWDSKILNQRSCAFIVFLPFPSFSYFVYSFSKVSLWTSESPGHSCGHIKVHSPFSLTRFINKSGIQSAKNKSLVLFSSFPWFFFKSRKSNTSACQGSI